MGDLQKELQLRIKELLKRCNHCGFCLEGCPTYSVTAQEWYCTRGRLDLIDHNLEEEVPGIAIIIKTCLLCGKCEAICPSKVEIAKIIRLYRRLMMETANVSHIPWSAKFAISSILPSPALLSFLKTSLAYVQDIGLVKPAQGFGGIFARGLSIIPSLENKTARKLLNKPIYRPSKETKGKVVYFLGCMSDQIYSQVALASINLLQFEGFEVFVPHVNCCGLPAYNYGLNNTFQKQAKNNINLINIEGMDAIISDCPSCVAMLQQYHSLVEDKKLKAKAQQISEKAFEIGGWLFEKVDCQKQIKNDLKVTYHRPCHLQYGLNRHGNPEQLLRGYGIEVVEAENRDYCCGGAGSYTIVEPEFSDAILSKKILGLKKTNTGHIVTSCPACMMQLNYGAAREKLAWKVSHLSEVLLSARNYKSEEVVVNE